MATTHKNMTGFVFKQKHIRKYVVARTIIIASAPMYDIGSEHVIACTNGVIYVLMENMDNQMDILVVAQAFKILGLLLSLIFLLVLNILQNGYEFITTGMTADLPRGNTDFTLNRAGFGNWTFFDMEIINCGHIT
ncbi:hypothetical protein ACJX0J_007520 [Zea mays]